MYYSTTVVTYIFIQHWGLENKSSMFRSSQVKQGILFIFNNYLNE